MMLGYVRAFYQLMHTQYVMLSKLISTAVTKPSRCTFSLGANQAAAGSLKTAASIHPVHARGECNTAAVMSKRRSKDLEERERLVKKMRMEMGALLEHVESELDVMRKDIEVEFCNFVASSDEELRHLAQVLPVCAQSARSITRGFIGAHC